MAKIALISLPYDCGRLNERMGRGPSHLIDQGLGHRLSAQGHEVEFATVHLSEGVSSDGQALVQLQQRAIPLVRDALAKTQRILLLSGNCGPAALTAVSALGGGTTGVIWFDAHADFNTPETSASGFLDGMALSVLTGGCWPALRARFDSFEPVPEKNVVLIGARDLDSAEATALRQSAITHIETTDIDALENAVETLAQRVESFYVHLDVDVLDRSEGCANSYASSGGLSARQLLATLERLAQSRRPKIAAITSYDPAGDDSGRIRRIINDAATILT